MNYTMSPEYLREPLTTSDFADAYVDAIDLLHKVEIQVVGVTVIWQKLFRVRAYLQAQAAAEFAEVLK